MGIDTFTPWQYVCYATLSFARLAYGMAEDGTLPKPLAPIHPQRQSPHIATFTIAAIAVVMIVALERIEVIANVVTFAFFITFIIINASVIALRYKEPDVPRVFRMPLNCGRVPVLAVIGIVSALVMMLNVGMTATLLGLGLAAIGALLTLKVSSGPRRIWFAP